MSELLPNQVRNIYANEGLYRLYTVLFGALFSSSFIPFGIAGKIDDVIGYNFIISLPLLLLSLGVIVFFFCKRRKITSKYPEQAFSFARSWKVIWADLFSSVFQFTVIIAISAFLNVEVAAQAESGEKKLVISNMDSLILILFSIGSLLTSLGFYRKDARLERGFTCPHKLLKESLVIQEKHQGMDKRKRENEEVELRKKDWS